MQKSRKNFIPKNEGFLCDACGKDVPPAKGTFRNHCPFCLTSKHVDSEIPGDRASTCQSSMKPIAIEGTDPDKLDIVYACQTCGKNINNRTAPDDNKEAVFALMQNRH